MINFNDCMGGDLERTLENSKENFDNNHYQDYSAMMKNDFISFPQESDSNNFELENQSYIFNNSFDIMEPSDKIFDHESENTNHSWQPAEYATYDTTHLNNGLGNHDESHDLNLDFSLDLSLNCNEEQEMYDQNNEILTIKGEDLQELGLCQGQNKLPNELRLALRDGNSTAIEEDYLKLEDPYEYSEHSEQLLNLPLFEKNPPDTSYDNLYTSPSCSNAPSPHVLPSQDFGSDSPHHSNSYLNSPSPNTPLVHLTSEQKQTYLREQNNKASREYRKRRRDKKDKLKDVIGHLESSREEKLLRKSESERQIEVLSQAISLMWQQQKGGVLYEERD